MNSKKMKDMLSNIEPIEYDSNVTIKKSRKKSSDILNQNTQPAKKSKKRKLGAEEITSVPNKKQKNQISNNEGIYNAKDSEKSVIRENIENNVPSPKVSKRKGVILATETQTDGSCVETNMSTNSIQPTKIVKKKKKKGNTEKIETPATPKTVADSASNVKIDKSSKTSNASNTDEIHNNSKRVEVDIVDIEGKKVDNEKNENVVTISIKDVDGMDSDWDENELLKQLERRVEKKDTSKEKKVKPLWPDVDLIQLVERMEAAVPENDVMPFLKRSEELEWDKIAFKDYSIEDCKRTWSLVLKRVRKYRILNEVLNDAKAWIQSPKPKKKSNKIPRHPDMPRRPLSAYFIYYLKKKDAVHAENPGLDATELAKVCSQQFKLLPSEKLIKYENIAKKNKIEYDIKMKEFYAKYPELVVDPKSKKSAKVKLPKPPKPVKEKPPPKPPKVPKEKAPKRPLSAFQYYQIAEMAKNEPEDKIAYKDIVRERWKEMPDDRKMEWIIYAEAEIAKYEEQLREYIKNNPAYVNNGQKYQLTKEELLVKERMSGRPSKPPVSAYNVFARTMLHSDDVKDVPVKDRLIFVSNQWKQCTEEEKKHYKELFNKTIEKYNKDFAAYLETLPETERNIELLKTQNKRRKSEDERAKKETKKKPLKKVENKSVKKKTVKKTDKKSEKKTPAKLVEPEQPPISAYKYFVKSYNGQEPSKAWKSLSAEEKKKYEDELVQEKKKYILDFEKFLKSMTKEELEHFSNTRQKNRKVEEEDDDEEEEDDDDEGDEDEEENGAGQSDSDNSDDDQD